MKSELRIALIYALIGILWIFFSDRAVEWLLGNGNPYLTFVQTYKGIFYVIVTSALLYGLLRTELQHRQQQEQKFKLLFVQNPNPMWVYDPSTFAFLEVNDEAIEKYGYSRDEFLNMTILDIRPKEDVGAVQDSVHNRQHPRDFGEWRHTTKDGKLLAVEITSQALMYEGKDAVIVVARDITERRQLELERSRNERLQLELKKEQEAYNTRSRFFSMASHELRTPLTVISASASMLQNYDERLSREKRSGQYEKILKQVHRLSEQLDEMLLLLRTEMASSSYQPQPEDLIQLCHDVIETLSSAYPRHKIDLDSNEKVLDVDIDHRLIWKVMTNLISNALKYSPEDTTVQVSIKRDGKMVGIQVIDKGIGIPDVEQAQLFEPFFRANNADGVQGTGLGLAIVKQAIALHGGDIRVESREGEGTTFFVTLPVNQAFIVER